MGIVKLKSTMHLPNQGLMMQCLPAWEDHPSWLTGIQALEAFHQWVATIVLPIAFAWIEEHWNEVYGAIDKLSDDPDDKKKYYADVGAVIAAAFQVVKQTPYYQEGLEAYRTFRNDLKEDRVNTSELNPTWTRITEEIRRATEHIFQKEKRYLDDTILNPGSGNDVDQK